MPWSVQLALPAVDLLFEEFELGRPPQPFEVPSVGDTLEERARLREATHRTLERKGVMSGGRLDPKLEDMLVVLARAPFAMTAAGDVDGTLVLARVASDGRDAVLARQTGNQLILTEVRTTGVVAAIVDLLPNIPPARGTSMSMPAPQQRPEHPSGENDEGYDPLAGARERPGSTSPQQRRIGRVFAQPRLGIGSISATTVTAAPGEGPRTQRLCQVTWWDFDQEQGAGPGRWYATVDGEPPTMTIHPGDNRQLVGYVQGLVGPHLP